MEKYGLIGHPIAHSQSPALFKAAYDGRFEYGLIEGKYFDESYRKFLKEYNAVNVTAPFKEAAFERADVVSGPAALIGAANILVRTEDGVKAYNSDFTGVILTLAEALFPGIIDEFYGSFGARAHIKVHQFVRGTIAGRVGHTPEALIVGLGGAGRAAAVAAAEIGCRTTLTNRTTSKVDSFIKSLPEYSFGQIDIHDVPARLNAFDIVIYCLPFALEGVGAECFKSGQLLLEANYRDPAFSGLALAKVQDAGVTYIPGTDWLLYQALSGYSLMTGETPDFGAMISVL